MDFYDTMAGHYDQVTQADQRRAGAEAFVDALTERFPAASSALDVACGTGLFTLPLAAEGIKTLGADLSGDMLTQARRAAKKAGTSAARVQRTKAMTPMRACSTGLL